MAYIYEPFYRVDDTRAASGGNGLGLYVVRELLKKEGFRYVFEPVEDGMRFYDFPIDKRLQNHKVSRNFLRILRKNSLGKGNNL